MSERTHHLCIDMQRLFTDEGPWTTPWIDRVIPRIAELAGRHAARTVFTRFIPPVSAADMDGRWRHYYEAWRDVTRAHLDPRLLDLVEPLARLAPPAVVIDKPVYSPFAGRKLLRLLRQRAVETLVVTGAETDVCVLASVLGAIDHGFHVVLVDNAICSSSDAGHDALMTMYRQRFTLQMDVVPVEEVLAAWPPVAG